MGGSGFSPPPSAAGQPPDVLCERGGDARPICFEVELPETLVRRTTVLRLRSLALTGVGAPGGAASASPRRTSASIAEARRMLLRAGLPVEVAAIAPDEETITGADW